MLTWFDVGEWRLRCCHEITLLNLMQAKVMDWVILERQARVKAKEPLCIRDTQLIEVVDSRHVW